MRKPQPAGRLDSAAVADVSTLTKVIIGAALAIGIGWWARVTFVPSSDEKIAVAEAEAKRNAAIVAKMVDSLVGARLASVKAEAAGTVVLTTPRVPPAPPRPNVPRGPSLDSLKADSLRKIVIAQDGHIDTLNARIDMLQRRDSVSRAVIADLTLASSRFRLFADSTIGSQARQIKAQQIIIDVRECRVLGLLKCPSRKVALIGGAVLGAVAVGYVKR